MVELPVGPNVSLSNAKESYLLHQVRVGIFLWPCLHPLYFLLRKVSQHCGIYSISVKFPENQTYRKRKLMSGCLYIRSKEEDQGNDGQRM